MTHHRCAQRPLDAATLAAAGPGTGAAQRALQGLIRHQAPPGQLGQLTRLTVAADEPAAAAQLLGPAPSPITASYDLLAVQPLSERVFQQARHFRLLLKHFSCGQGDGCRNGSCSPASACIKRCSAVSPRARSSRCIPCSTFSAGRAVLSSYAGTPLLCQHGLCGCVL
jgi:hypothetical protein